MLNNKTIRQAKEWVVAHRGIVLSALVLWGIYQWYYVSPACSLHSKTAWMWMTPQAHPGQPDKSAADFVLLRVPSSYIAKGENNEYRYGGKVRFLNLQANLDDFSPICLRENALIQHERVGPVRRVPPNHPEYVDDYDLKHVSIGVNAPNISGVHQQPDTSLQLLKKNEHGFDVYIDKLDQPGKANEYLFLSRRDSKEARAFYCTRSFFFEHRRTLCSTEIPYKGLRIQYRFHASQLPQWQNIERKTLSFLDSLIIIHH